MHNRKGQAVVEMAIFGGLILFLLGTLVSFLQQGNDQQYVAMETFRRTLEKACNYVEGTGMGAGASVQYTNFQMRHNADVSGGYKKGNPSLSSGSASVFWAVPKLDKAIKPQTLIVFKMNENENTYNYRTEFVDDAHDKYDENGVPRQKYWTFQIVNIDTKSNTQFSEKTVKEEDGKAITNTKTSTLNHEFTPAIKYNIVERDKDDEAYRGYPNGEDVKTLWAPVQYVYRDSSDGQYKYSESAGEAGVARGKVWKTNF